MRIESSAAMSLVDVDVGTEIFCSLVLEVPQTAAYLKIGTTVHLLFKETEVSIAKNLSGLISLRNRVKSRIKEIEKSKILSKVILDFQHTDIVSIISTRSAEKLELKIGDEVEWLVKTNEVTISYED